jgi:hypothetical protein
VWKSWVRRDAERRQHADAIAALQPRTVALAVEIGVELTAKRRAIGRDPVIGEGKRAPDIGRSEIADAVDAGLQRIAAPGAERIRQSPIGAAAGQRKAHDGVRADVIIHAGGKAERVRRDIVRADARIAIGSVAAAICGTPGGPALIEGRPRRRLGEDRRIGERDIGRQIILLLWRKANGAAACGAEPALPAVDERIEHQCQELVGQLECGAFGAGAGFAIQLRQRIEQRRTGRLPRPRNGAGKGVLAGLLRIPLLRPPITFCWF